MTNRIEEIASNVMGTAKAAKAAVEGRSALFRHLEREHGEVSALLMRLRVSSDPDVRSELFPTIRYELLSHETAERRELYTVLLQHSPTREIAEAHDMDADVLDQAIVALTNTAVDSPEWQPALEQLSERVRAHVEREESEYFPLAQRTLGPQADALLEPYERAKAAALRELKSTP